jgi:glyoxylase-like metal-dependent hydrolase (beta-lactamase superfamily II)
VQCAVVADQESEIAGLLVLSFFLDSSSGNVEDSLRVFEEGVHVTELIGVRGAGFNYNFPMIRRILLGAIAVGAAVIGTLNAQSKLELKVHAGRGVNGYDVNSTMISGANDMILIDPQFGLAEAHRLAAEIIESKKNLTTIYVTHPHPDHFFGLAVLKQAFPAARIVALPATANAIKTAWPARQKFWFPTYGSNIPGPEPVLPEELAMPVLTLEGEQFPITGGLQGDGPGNSFVYIPSLNAVVAGDTVFDHVYFGVPKDKAREDWMRTLDQIAAMKPSVLIPGHEGPGATHNLAAIAWMKKYIADWDANVAASKNAAEMRERVVRQYPGLGMEFTPNDRVAAFFPAK